MLASLANDLFEMGEPVAEKAIRTKLPAAPQTKAPSPDTSARDGVVLLQGTVATQAIKQKAISLARQGEGVVQVIDRITVRK